ncbi:MAG: carboxypeptidase regulatory-like domain-containing protein, partial [Candidatus Eremiobacteraeota bacterium]|nr:carboxypeptidase regulatory-like domain-containing protein [Candidatus Eremiobacteraeota bacterium]
MRPTRIRQSLTAVVVLFVFLVQGTWTLAGTTGTLSGNVVDSSANSAVAGAKVTVVSPSQTATVSTDAAGHFVFLALAPDTYTVSIDKQGYDPLSQSGINIFADQNQTINLSLMRTLRVIGRVTSRSQSDLVKPSTTSDIYSISAITAEKASVLGGGGSMQQMYSAIAASPGTYVPTGQNGWNQYVYIRGSNYDQTGYEYDGVPVNRAFDNYAAHTGTSLGQQELQVYTGGGPASASATGLGGFIN